MKKIIAWFFKNFLENTGLIIMLVGFGGTLYSLNFQGSLPFYGIIEIGLGAIILQLEGIKEKLSKN
jgi:hypothetical protein